MRYEIGLNKIDIHNRLKSIRKELLFTQKEFAQKMDLSFRTYQRFENMEGLPSKNYLENFCKLTGVNYDWVVYGREPKWAKDINKEVHSMSISDQKTVYNADINADLQVINKILSSDNVLRKRILNFLKMYRNLEKFDEGE